MCGSVYSTVSALESVGYETQRRHLQRHDRPTCCSQLYASAPQGARSVALAHVCTNLTMHTALTDPRNRFAGIDISVPDVAWPALQSSFKTPPDCGENSYTGSGRLLGRRALVTGGDSGIGRAIVIAFAREGADVAINYLPEEESDAQALADFLAKEGLSLTKISGDLMDEAFCGSLVQQANKQLGGLDLIVNNAGCGRSTGTQRAQYANSDRFGGPLFGSGYQPTSTFSTAQLDRVFRTNLYANLFVTRAAVPLLPPGASIINTASVVAYDPAATFVDYAASKAAIISVTRSLSKQLAPHGIRVNAVAPGLVYTPLLASSGINSSVLANLVSGYPMPRVAMPAELAPIYVHLAAADMTFVTGSIWGATGGLSGF
jgi:NAD(P)-dependent dehydrogenase (short-subunit alcohol dehydrogenase family)